MWSTLSLGKYAVSPVGTPVMTERGTKGDEIEGCLKKEKREQRKEESRRLNGLTVTF